MFVGWVQLFFLTNFYNTLLIAIEPQMNNKNKTKNIKLNS